MGTDLEKINNIKIAQVNEQIHLNCWLVWHREHYKDEQGSASEKHDDVGQRQKPVCVYPQVERANLSFHAGSPQL